MQVNDLQGKSCRKAAACARIFNFFFFWLVLQSVFHLLFEIIWLLEELGMKSWSSSCGLAVKDGKPWARREWKQIWV